MEKREERFEIIKPFLEKEKTLKEISQETNISYATLKRWIKNYKDEGIDGLKIKERADKNSFRKADKSVIELINNIYINNKEKSLINLYNETEKYMKKSLSFNTFYRIINNLDSYLKNKTKVQISENIKNGEIYLIKTFITHYFINQKRGKKIPIILLVFNASTLDFIDFYITFNNKFDKNILSFIRRIILKGQNIYNILSLPKEILIDSIFSIPKNIKNSIQKKSGIKLLEFEANNDEIDRFISFLREDLNEVFQKNFELEYVDFYNFFKNYCPYTSLEDKNIFLNDEPKLNIFFPIVKRKVYSFGIRINNIFYNSEILKNYIGKIFDVMYDPLDDTFIYLYFDNSFIAKLKK